MHYKLYTTEIFFVDPNQKPRHSRSTPLRVIAYLPWDWLFCALSVSVLKWVHLFDSPYIIKSEQLFCPPWHAKTRAPTYTPIVCCFPLIGPDSLTFTQAPPLWRSQGGFWLAERDNRLLWCVHMCTAQTIPQKLTRVFWASADQSAMSLKRGKHQGFNESSLASRTNYRKQSPSLFHIVSLLSDVYS